MIEELEWIKFPITGLNCEACAAGVEQALKEIPGVVVRSVDLAHGNAVVYFPVSDTDTWDIVSAVREAGYDVPTEEHTYFVQGMSCISCAAHVEGALSDIPGVVSADVDLRRETATVNFIPNIVNIPDLQSALNGSGYRLSVDLRP